MNNSFFADSDDIIKTLQKLLNGASAGDKAKFVGFVSVCAVTKYELGIKKIINGYADSKHVEFGIFVSKYLSRLNGRINLGDLRGLLKDYFDAQCIKKFDIELEKIEKNILQKKKLSVGASYKNLILCRHNYVHSDILTLSFQESIQDYNLGKYVIKALSRAMHVSYN